MNIFVISQLFEARLGSTRNTPEGSVQAKKTHAPISDSRPSFTTSQPQDEQLQKSRTWLWGAPSSSRGEAEVPNKNLPAGVAPRATLRMELHCEIAQHVDLTRAPLRIKMPCNFVMEPHNSSFPKSGKTCV